MGRAGIIASQAAPLRKRAPVTQQNHADSILATSAGLLSGMGKFDSGSWSRFVRIYGPMVSHWCRQLGLQPSDADDVTQRVFLSVYNSVERFEYSGRKGGFRRWLKTITRNKAIDFWRARDAPLRGVGGSDFRHSLEQIANPKSSQFLDSTESVEHLQAEEDTLKKLAMEHIQSEFQESSWQAFWLTAVEGKNSTEAASLLKTTPAAVRKAKSRVLRRVKEVLEKPI